MACTDTIKLRSYGARTASMPGLCLADSRSRSSSSGLRAAPCLATSASSRVHFHLLCRSGGQRRAEGKGVEGERRAEGSGICSLLQLCSRSLAGRIAYGAGRIAVGVGRVAVGTGRIGVGAGRIAVCVGRTAVGAGRIAGPQGGSEISCDCLATVSRLSRDCLATVSRLSHDNRVHMQALLQAFYRAPELLFLCCRDGQNSVRLCVRA
eukprot:gene2440-biopygen8629